MQTRHPPPPPTLTIQYSVLILQGLITVQGSLLLLDSMLCACLLLPPPFPHPTITLTIQYSVLILWGLITVQTRHPPSPTLTIQYSVLILQGLCLDLAGSDCYANKTKYLVLCLDLAGSDRCANKTKYLVLCLDLAGSDCCSRQPVGAAGLHAVCLRTPPGSHSPGARSGWMLRGHPRSHTGPSSLHHARALRDHSGVVDLC